MTIQEFVDALRREAGKSVWWAKPCINTTVAGNCYCPVTFVCMATLGRHFPASRWPKAGRALGLSEDDAMLIAASSDGTFPGNQETRDRILAAVGLASAVGQ